MTATGVVHFGPGAFHRAHQADYFNRLIDEDPRWGIAAVSLRSPQTIEALRRQEGRYTLAIRDAEPIFRPIAVHNRFLGPGEGKAVRALLASPEVRIVSSTVTEKGYCLGPDGTLDLDHADVIRDLARPSAPDSLVGWLALGLADRRDAGLPPFATLCCDNMVSNGRKLGAAVAAFARVRDPDLAAWIEGEVLFPDTMVDAIVPATDDRLRRAVAEQGLDDAIPVGREAYSAWVIEDVLPADRPALDHVGALFTTDVAAWERAKLRILNGAHSTLAYLGLLRGHQTVSEAMRDDLLARFVERLIRDDITPGLAPSSIDLDRYAADVLTRFRNPSIGHRLAQIAGDGSQKLPYRLFDTIGAALESGRPVDRLALPVAAWIVFLDRAARAGQQIVDPLAVELAEAAVAPDAIDRLMAMPQIFPPALADSNAFRRALTNHVDRLRLHPMTID